jgi:hypothetical protein
VSLIRRTAGRRIVRARPCKDWRMPTTAALQGQWQPAAAGTLFHSRLEPSHGRPLREVVLCPKVPRLDQANEESTTPRNCFSVFGAAAAFLATHKWDWLPDPPPRRQHVLGVDAQRFRPEMAWMPDLVEVPAGVLPSILVYTNKYPIEAYVPTEAEVFDVAHTGEVWDVRPSPVRLVQRLAPLQTLLLRQDVAAFHSDVETDGLEAAVAGWTLGDVDPNNYTHLGDWEEVQYWTTPALDYSAVIAQHYLDVP